MDKLLQKEGKVTKVPDSAYGKREGENVKILQRNVWPAGRCRTAVRQAIHFFVNFNIFKWLYLAYYWVYFHQTWGVCESCCTLSDHIDQ